jgi:hypothetical protein
VAYRWELDGPAQLDAASLPEHVRQKLDRFMEAVTIVDPAEYERAPGDPNWPLRTLAFGTHGEGLVTFLEYPPDEGCDSEVADHCDPKGRKSGPR